MKVQLAATTGQFWDRALRWGIIAGETKELPEPLPSGSMTAQKLRMGGLIEVEEGPLPFEQMSIAQPIDLAGALETDSIPQPKLTKRASAKPKKRTARPKRK